MLLSRYIKYYILKHKSKLFSKGNIAGFITLPLWYCSKGFKFENVRRSLLQMLARLVCVCVFVCAQNGALLLLENSGDTKDMICNMNKEKGSQFSHRLH